MSKLSESLLPREFFVDPVVWGESVWRYLHVFAAAFDPRVSEVSPAKVIMEIAKSLPCPACREHMSLYLKSNPVPEDSRESLVKYVNEMHNIVSKRLGKETFTDEESAEETSAFAKDRLGLGKSNIESAVILGLAGIGLGALIYMGYSAIKKSKK